MDIRAYFKQVSWLVVINMAIKPIWIFAIDRKFQLALGQEAYGLYFSMLGMMYILSLVLDLGLHTYTVKAVSEAQEHTQRSIHQLWMSKGILISIYIFGVILAIVWQDLDTKSSWIFALIAIEMLSYSIFQYLRCFVQGLQLFRLDTLLSVLDRLLLILLGAGLLLLHSGLHISLESFIAFHIVAYLASFIYVYARHYKQLGIRFVAIDSEQLFQIIRQGWPLILITLLMTIYTRIDVVLLQKLTANGEAACGILAYSHRLIDSSYNALSLLALFLLPTIAKHAQTNLAYVYRVVWYSFLAATAMTICCFIGGYFLADKIYDILYHTDDPLAIAVFRHQLWAVIGTGWMYVFGSYLTATGRWMMLITIVASGAILSLILNLSWIPTQSVIGVARSSAIVQMTMGIAHGLGALYYLRQDKNPNTQS